jgi:hypothetical protein
LAEIAFESHALRDLKRRDDAPLDLLARLPGGFALLVSAEYEPPLNRREISPYPMNIDGLRDVDTKVKECLAVPPPTAKVGVNPRPWLRADAQFLITLDVDGQEWTDSRSHSNLRVPSS